VFLSPCQRRLIRLVNSSDTMNLDPFFEVVLPFPVIRKLDELIGCELGLEEALGVASYE
jgi:hypothetical protein